MTYRVHPPPGPDRAEGSSGHNVVEASFVIERAMLDVVNECDEVIGQIPNSERSSLNVILRYAFVLLADRSGQLLLQMRSAAKKEYPLYWSGSAAGHPTSGESYVTGGEREVWEQLGVRVRLESVSTFYSSEHRRMVGVLFGFHNGPVTIARDKIARVERFSPQRLTDLGGSLSMTSFLDRALTLVLPRLERLRTSGYLTAPPPALPPPVAEDVGVNQPASRARLAARWASCAADHLAASATGAERLVGMLMDAAATLRAVHELLADTPGQVESPPVGWRGEHQDAVVAAHSYAWRAAVAATFLFAPGELPESGATKRYRHAAVLSALATDSLHQALSGLLTLTSRAGRQSSATWGRRPRPSSTPPAALGAGGDTGPATERRGRPHQPRTEPLTVMGLVGDMVSAAHGRLHMLPVLVHVDLDGLQEVHGTATGVQVIRCRNGSYAVLISAVPDDPDREPRAEHPGEQAEANDDEIASPAVVLPTADGGSQAAT